MSHGTREEHDEINSIKYMYITHSHVQVLTLSFIRISFHWAQNEQPKQHHIFNTHTPTLWHCVRLSPLSLSPTKRRYPHAHQVARIVATTRHCREIGDFLGRTSPSGLAFTNTLRVFIKFSLLYGGERTIKYPVRDMRNCLCRNTRNLLGRRTIKFWKMSNLTLCAMELATWWCVRTGIECGT